MNIVIGILFIILTIAVYYGMKCLYKRFPHPLLVPIATSTIIIVPFLLFSQISYRTYMIGGNWIDELLGPAVVSFAIPLYEQRKIVRENIVNILASVFIGALIGIVSGLLLGKIFHIDKMLALSLAAKSVTTPVAMDLTEIIGGTPALAAVYVILAGIFGAIFGPMLLRMLKVKRSLSIGLGFGTAAHGIGTAKVIEYGKLEGAVSSVSMTLSAIFTSILCPIIVSIML
ncbi:LrgB family protein [Metabacillus fastidiosus]|uniref:LrgB family protein n=1 Tax=Metabacillus fastidiosus TaxID=1458 RepID=UPI002E24BC95|nr:LrgB family protein [Metabacillus fastidiosus]